MRDYISHEVQNASRLFDDLDRQERTAREARGRENGRIRNDAERRAGNVRDRLLVEVSSAAAYELLEATKRADATSLRTAWQDKNRSVDCLSILIKKWKEGKRYLDIFASPIIDLSVLPAYSFVIQLAFRLAQPYISRDEQDFYIIDNPVRKDKIFSLPYVASTSWKGSLRSAFWYLGYRENNEVVHRLFGNEKGTEGSGDFQAGRLRFFPTFFTWKSLEIINPQDRKLRAGTNPILFESVPEGSEGIFTLLYVPFDRIGEDEKETRNQLAGDLASVTQGIQAMFRTHGFGAKTSSGFGLAREDVKGTLSMQTRNRSEQFGSFGQLTTMAEQWSLN